MARYGLLGDVHANYSWMAFSLWKLHHENIEEVLQVGDFGIGQTKYNQKFLKRTSKLAVHYGIKLRIVPGNHEDHNYITELIGDNNDEWAELMPNLFIAPRGLRWTWDDTSFVALGGAPSVDRGWRREDQADTLDAKYHHWFPGEMITEEDVDRVVAGGYADVMVAHDAPENVPTIDARIKNNPHGFRADDLAYAAEGRSLMTRAFRGVSPRTFIHGHYHFLVDDMVPSPPRNADEALDEIPYTHILGLANDEQNYSLGHYDTVSKKAHAWNIKADTLAYMAAGGTFRP